MAWVLPIDLLGLTVSGDLAGLTIWTRKDGRKVSYPFSPPTSPATSKQLHQRSRFRLAQQRWKNLTTSEQEALEELCRESNAPLTGQNLWIHVALTNDQKAMTTLERQTDIIVTHPQWIP